MLPDNGRKVKERFDYHMSTKEVAILFKYASRWSFKYQLLLSLCAFRGLRVSEALAVNYRTDFLDSDFTRLMIREAKVNKRRTLPIIRPLADMIKKYVILNAPGLRNGFLFPYYSHKKLPYMTTETAGSLMQKLRKIIGKEHPRFLEKYTFPSPDGKKIYVRHRIGYHSLRRWFETTLFNKTESLFIVKEIMAYTDFKVLNSYLNTANVREREELLLNETFNPLMNDFQCELLGQTKLNCFILQERLKK